MTTMVLVLEFDIPSDEISQTMETTMNAVKTLHLEHRTGNYVAIDDAAGAVLAVFA